MNMKLYFQKLLLLTLLSFLTSCSEDFDLKSEFKQQYVLNCIINGDTTYQFASISKTFDVEGYDPSVNEKDLTVSDAVINIFYNGNDYLLRDTIVLNTDGSESFIYYTNSLQPESNKTLNIEAVMNDGTTLKSTTTTPKAGNLTFFPEDVVTDYSIGHNTDGQTLFWEITDPENNNALFLPSLKIIYYKEESGIDIKKEKLVPLYYYNSVGGELLPFYPIVTELNQITFNISVLNQAMNEISGEDTLKANYKIDAAIFELYILDRNLAPYILTSQSFNDGFTVLLDQLDYSNIEGGYGVFGSFFKKNLKISFDVNYLESFGYVLYSP